MRHTTAAILAVATLGLAGCSGSGRGEPTKPTTSAPAASPSVDAAGQRQACVDAWLAVMTADGYDPDAGLENRPSVCEGQRDQAGMYADALVRRNEQARKPLDDCLADPSCTSLPVP
ncbi:hypothetical protein ACFV5G_19490 [Streptomyces sp. NPDC059766]|uniref:hypothetical protein n=1 Tax=Streptomyces sp. NPDC059766 TaxID=3346940 RepID=UPI00364F4338